MPSQNQSSMKAKPAGTTEIWKEMVYNKDITNAEINSAYGGWAEEYDRDFALVHPNRAEHMAVFLDELVTAEGLNKSELTILDVAAGTGLVGEELKKKGFSVDKVTALDFSPEMLEVSRKKGVYGKLIEAPFGSTIPKGLKAKSYDCVIMCGGFAAGHVPLSSLHTMARLCKDGGFLINSMTKQYCDFVPEYTHIDKYIEELEEDGVWKIMFRRILDQYTKGNQGLVHAMQVKKRAPKGGPEAGSATTEIWRKMVYNKDITNDEINSAYGEWAEQYDQDFALVHPDRAKHMADFLLEMVEGAGLNKEQLTILDVAAGTGLVGEELKKAGFNVNKVTATDFSAEMLEVSRRKGVYGRLIQSPFGSSMPEGMKAASYDCVIMCGGFAAGHVPLVSLYTMARLCKKGGFLINSMTKQYADFVDEYKNIDQYIEELEEDGVWKIQFRRILQQYTKGNQGLVHGMKVL